MMETSAVAYVNRRAPMQTQPGKGSLDRFIKTLASDGDGQINPATRLNKYPAQRNQR